MSEGRWLVTGAGGQLGQSLLELSPPAGVEWVGVKRSELDVADADAVAGVLREVDPTVVVNTAAFTHVDRCEDERDEAWRVNATAPELLARNCQGRALLVHLSTEYVFDGQASRPIPEDAPVDPQSVYGKSKAAGEAAVRGSRCEHLIVRTQWLFGPGRNFVRTMLEKGLAREPLRVVEDQVGRPTSTAELARGIVCALDGGARGTVHIACEGLASWYDFAQEIISRGVARGLTKDVRVEPVGSEAFPRPAPRPHYGVLDLQRARGHGVRLSHWTRALEAYLDREARGHE